MLAFRSCGPVSLILGDPGSSNETLLWLVTWSELRQHLLGLYNSCTLASALERRFLFLTHPLEWFLKAAEVEKERPQQQDIDDIIVEVHKDAV